MLLVLGLAGAQAQQASGKAKVDRLVMGLILPYLDYMRPWINGTPDHMIQHDPAFEWLFEVSPEGQYTPWLAESWELAQDGRSWHIKLHGKGSDPQSRPVVRRSISWPERSPVLGISEWYVHGRTYRGGQRL
jgi:hypothetical protein